MLTAEGGITVLVTAENSPEVSKLQRDEMQRAGQLPYFSMVTPRIGPPIRAPARVFREAKHSRRRREISAW
jgi:hypothetical protein